MNGRLPLAANPAAKVAGVLGDAAVKEALRKFAGKPIQLRAGLHRRCDRDDIAVIPGQIAQDARDRFAPGTMPSRQRCERLAAVGIKGRDAMPCAFLVILRVWIAFALLGQHMDDDRSLMPLWPP